MLSISFGFSLILDSLRLDTWNFIVIINLLVTNSLLKTFTIFSYLVTSGVDRTALYIYTFFFFPRYCPLNQLSVEFGTHTHSTPEANLLRYHCTHTLDTHICTHRFSHRLSLSLVNFLTHCRPLISAYFQFLPTRDNSRKNQHTKSVEFREIWSCTYIHLCSVFLKLREKNQKD